MSAFIVMFDKTKPVLVRADDSATAVSLVVEATGYAGAPEKAKCLVTKTSFSRFVRGTLLWYSRANKYKISLSASAQPIAFCDVATPWGGRISSFVGVGKWVNKNRVHAMRPSWLGYTGFAGISAADVRPLFRVARFRDKNRIKFFTGIIIPDGEMCWRGYARSYLLGKVRDWVSQETAKLMWLGGECDRELEMR